MFEKVLFGNAVLLGVKEFHGLHDELKIYIYMKFFFFSYEKVNRFFRTTVPVRTPSLTPKPGVSLVPIENYRIENGESSDSDVSFFIEQEAVTSTETIESLKDENLKLRQELSETKAQSCKIAYPTVSLNLQKIEKKKVKISYKSQHWR